MKPNLRTSILSSAVAAGCALSTLHPVPTFAFTAAAGHQAPAPPPPPPPVSPPPALVPPLYDTFTDPNNPANPNSPFNINNPANLASPNNPNSLFNPKNQPYSAENMTNPYSQYNLQHPESPYSALNSGYIKRRQAEREEYERNTHFKDGFLHIFEGDHPVVVYRVGDTERECRIGIDCPRPVYAAVGVQAPAQTPDDAPPPASRRNRTHKRHKTDG